VESFILLKIRLLKTEKINDFFFLNLVETCLNSHIKVLVI